MTALDRLLERGLPATLAAVRAARRRVERVVRAHPHVFPSELLALVRREILRAEPLLAKALTGGILAAWVSAARGPARGVLPVTMPPESESATVYPPFTTVPRPAPWFDPPRATGTAVAADPLVRFPAVEAAVADLLSRQAVTATQFAQLDDDARRAAFTVARVVTEDAVGEIQDAVTRHVGGGGTLRQFREEVGDVLTAAGLDDHHVEAIYRTQTGQARAAGMRAVLEHELIADEFPYVKYVPVFDGRTRHEHAELGRLGLNGTGVYRRDDPVMIRYWPPWAWNCRCYAIPLTVEDAAAEGVQEARRWLATGVPPTRPEYVSDPGFKLPKGWPVPSPRITPVLT